MNNLQLTERTFTITYEELEGALVSFLQTTGQLNPVNDFVVELDIDVGLNDYGLVEFDVVTTDCDQLEFNFA